MDTYYFLTIPIRTILPCLEHIIEYMTLLLGCFTMYFILFYFVYFILFYFYFTCFICFIRFWICWIFGVLVPWAKFSVFLFLLCLLCWNHGGGVGEFSWWTKAHCQASWVDSTIKLKTWSTRSYWFCVLAPWGTKTLNPKTQWIHNKTKPQKTLMLGVILIGKGLTIKLPYLGR